MNGLKKQNIGNYMNQDIKVIKPIEKKEEIRAICHICIPPKGFPSIDKLQEHTLKEHRVYKG